MRLSLFLGSCVALVQDGTDTLCHQPYLPAGSSAQIQLSFPSFNSLSPTSLLEVNISDVLILCGLTTVVPQELCLIASFATPTMESEFECQHHR